MAILTDAHQAKLRRSLKLHVIVALLTTMVLIVVNLVTTPRYPWWMWVAVAWSAPLAIHTAIAMELFGRKD